MNDEKLEDNSVNEKVKIDSNKKIGAEVIQALNGFEVVRETDKTLAVIPRLVRSIFAGVYKFTLRSEMNLKVYEAEIEKELSKKLKYVSEEDITEPEKYVAGPSIEGMEYCMDCDELRDMYANLLSKSMYTKTKRLVYPSYAQIIKQLTPDEANLLNYFYKNDLKMKSKCGCLTMGYLYPIEKSASTNKRNKLKDNKATLKELEQLILNKYDKIILYENKKLTDKSFPKSFVRRYYLGGEVHLMRNFSIAGIKAECILPERIREYTDNLIRLRLIGVENKGLNYINYDEIINSSLLLNELVNIIEQPPKYIFFNFGYIYMTDFGKNFANICCTPITKE